MAWEFRVLDIPGQIAGEDFSAAGVLTGYNSTGQFLAVKNNGTANTCVHCSTVTDRPIGISQNNPVNASALQVRALGVTKWIAGGTVSPGDEVGTDTAGRCVKRDAGITGADIGDYAMGVVLEGAATGELATVLLAGVYRV